MEGIDVQAIVRQAIEEFALSQAANNQFGAAHRIAMPAGKIVEHHDFTVRTAQRMDHV